MRMLKYLFYAVHFLAFLELILILKFVFWVFTSVPDEFSECHQYWETFCFCDVLSHYVYIIVYYICTIILPNGTIIIAYITSV